MPLKLLSTEQCSYKVCLIVIVVSTVSIELHRTALNRCWTEIWSRNERRRHDTRPRHSTTHSRLLPVSTPPARAATQPHAARLHSPTSIAHHSLPSQTHSGALSTADRVVCIWQMYTQTDCSTFLAENNRIIVINIDIFFFFVIKKETAISIYFTCFGYLEIILANCFSS